MSDRDDDFVVGKSDGFGAGFTKRIGDLEVIFGQVVSAGLRGSGITVDLE